MQPSPDVGPLHSHRVCKSLYLIGREVLVDFGWLGFQKPDVSGKQLQADAVFCPGAPQPRRQKFVGKQLRHVR
jgi:hypothetical protein